jgi:hypothetical protein
MNKVQILKTVYVKGSTIKHNEMQCEETECGSTVKLVWFSVWT